MMYKPDGLIGGQAGQSLYN